MITQWIEAFGVRFASYHIISYILFAQISKSYIKQYKHPMFESQCRVGLSLKNKLSSVVVRDRVDARVKISTGLEIT